MTTNPNPTPPTDPTILLGIEGFRAALADPEQWEFDAPCNGDWCKLSDELEQNIGSKYLTQPAREWRRRPAKEEREAMRVSGHTHLLASASLRDIVRLHGEGRQRAIVNLDLDNEWIGKRARITIEELYKPEPSPGSIITWQEAQWRVDAGLAVETLNDENNPSGSWRPAAWYILPLQWTYRIPLPKAEPQPERESVPAADMTEPVQKPEAVTMTECAALEYLKAGTDYTRAVMDRDGEVWTYGDGKVVLHASECGCTIMLGAPFTPLLPAAQTQLALQAEVDALKKQVAAQGKRLETKRILDDRDEKEWNAFTSWSQERYNDPSLESKTFALCGDSHVAAARKTIEGLSDLINKTRAAAEQQLREVTAERDAAVKDLATERNLNKSIKRCMRRIADEGKGQG